MGVTVRHEVERVIVEVGIQTLISGTVVDMRRMTETMVDVTSIVVVTVTTETMVDVTIIAAVTVTAGTRVVDMMAVTTIETVLRLREKVAGVVRGIIVRSTMVSIVTAGSHTMLPHPEKGVGKEK
jgi:hypothetical protein